VTTSTKEAELHALFQAAKESMYVSRFVEELGVKLDHLRGEKALEKYWTAGTLPKGMVPGGVCQISVT